MKHISYSFSNSDIEAITFALTVLPSLELEETEAQAAICLVLLIAFSLVSVKFLIFCTLPYFPCFSPKM